MDLAFLSQSAITIEPIFSWQGLGAYFVEAARFRDLPVLQAGLLGMSVLFIPVNLVVDILVMMLNPLQRRPGQA
jgi:peptide/nickel transport system permease protein